MESKKKQLVAVIPHSCEGVDVSDTTAGQADVRSGKYFYSALGERVEGQIADYSGAVSVTPAEQAQTVATGGKYVGSDITVSAIPSEYKDTTGTDATASDILAGKKAVTGAGLVTGNYVPPSPTLVTKNITANGTYAASSDNADGYSSVTVNVPATPAAPIAENDVTFYDYDGTVVASYTAADFANLSAMPANPTHTGLVAEGWNWTLADAKTYVASYGKLNIGQMYHTESGKTEYDIEVNEATGMTATLGLSGREKDWGDGTTDTLESHNYTTAGNYTIKLSGTTLPSIAGSKKVRAVRIANGVTSIGQQAFANCRGLTSVTIPNSVTSIESSAFYYCYRLQCITLPDGITSIAKTDVFYNNVSLILLLFPKSVESFGLPSFPASAMLYSLKHLTFPSNLLTIGTEAFRNSYNLQFVTIPNSVTSVGGSAFRQCYSLQSVTIPSSVTSIGSNAFNDCSWLTIMTVLATTPPTLSATNAIPSNITKIYIPNGTLTDYQGASNWASFSSKFVELPA